MSLFPPFLLLVASSFLARGTPPPRASSPLPPIGSDFFFRLRRRQLDSVRFFPICEEILLSRSSAFFCDVPFCRSTTPASEDGSSAPSGMAVLTSSIPFCHPRCPFHCARGNCFLLRGAMASYGARTTSPRRLTMTTVHEERGFSVPHRSSLHFNRGSPPSDAKWPFKSAPTSLRSVEHD